MKRRDVICRESVLWASSSDQKYYERLTHNLTPWNRPSSQQSRSFPSPLSIVLSIHSKRLFLMYAQNAKNIARIFPSSSSSRLLHTTVRREASEAAARNPQKSREDNEQRPPSRKYKRKPPPIPHEGIQVTADIVTGNIIKRASRKWNPGDWKHEAMKNAEERRLESVVPTKKNAHYILPSAEQQKFFSWGEYEEGSSELPGPEMDTLGVWSQIQPGTFVEVRRLVSFYLVSILYVLTHFASCFRLETKSLLTPSSWGRGQPMVS